MADFLNHFSIFNPVPSQELIAGSPADFLRKVAELRRQASDLEAIALIWPNVSDELLAIAVSLNEQAEKLDALREKRIPEFWANLPVLQENRALPSHALNPLREPDNWDKLDLEKTSDLIGLFSKVPNEINKYPDRPERYHYDNDYPESIQRL